MNGSTYTFTGEVWLHDGPAGWHFVTLPAEIADEIEARFDDRHRPFGSVAVHVSIGDVAWTTSLFKDTKTSSYLLPVKAEVRRRAGIDAGDTVTLTLAVEDS